MSLKRDRDDTVQSEQTQENKRLRTEPPTLLGEPIRDGDGDRQRDQEQERRLPYPDITKPLPRTVVPTPFQQPTQLTTFSYTVDRELLFNNSAMKYYAEPPRGAKLNYGYERWVKQMEERGRIDSLLKALSRIRGDPTRQGAVKELGVVSWRGVMTK